MIRRLLIALCVLSALPVAAQTPSFKLNWTQIEPLATVQTFQYTLKVDTGTPTLVTATCVTQGTGTSCTTPLTALASGPHTLVLTAFNGFGSTAADPLSGVPPSKPAISVTVTITIP